MLEWPYLRFVEEHPAKPDIPSWIIRGDQDEMVPLDTLSSFIGAPGVEFEHVTATGGCPCVVCQAAVGGFVVGCGS